MADADFEVLIKLRLDQGDLAGQAAGQIAAVKGLYGGLGNDLDKLEKHLLSADKAHQAFARNLSTTRYALYDVSSSLAAVAVGALALPVASATVAVQWERDFANVVRTSQATEQQLSRLRDQLIELSTTMPVSFETVTQIATLGNQLGISSGALVEFTDTVIKFSAATGISAEESAQAFGRLGNILGVAASEYENLGSSIVKAGISAAATESEIIAVAQQIGPIARLAGVSAEEVIGLSTAFASVKIPPELARSVITKTFGDINRAIAEGGPRMEAFGRALGISGKQFADAWTTDATGTFIQFLQAIPKDGVGAQTMLDELGLSSQRNTPGLQKLAQNIDLVRKSLRESGSGYQEATELNRQYGVIAETTAAKLQILGNSFAALLATIGGTTTGPLGALADYLSDILGMLTKLAGSGAGQVISAIVIGLGALVGIIAAVGAAAAVGFAGIIAMQQALMGLTGSTAVASIGLRGLIVQLGAVGGAGSVAAAGLNAAIFAMRGLAVAAAALVGLQISAWISDLSYAIKGLPQELPQILPDLKKTFEGGVFKEGAMTRTIADIDAFDASLQRFGAGMSGGIWKEIQKADEQLAALARGGNIESAKKQFLELREAWTAGGGDRAPFNELFTDTRKAITEAGQAAAAAGPAFGPLNDALNEVEGEAAAAKAALDALNQAILGIGSTSVAQEQALISQSQAFNQLSEAAADSTATITGTNAASLAYRSAMIDVETTSRQAALALIDNGESADVATAAYRAGREAIIASMTAKGMDSAAAAAWADKVLGSAAEAEAGIRQYSAETDRIPPKKNTTLTHNAPQAGQSLRAYINMVESANRTVVTNIITRYSSTGDKAGQTQSIRNPATYRYASGGSIWGPGTGRSDSIPIWASNGEFMMTARAHAFYGTAFMNAINSLKAPKFASGGPVGGGGMGIGGIMELGPKSLERMGSGPVNVTIMLDDVALSRAVQKGDAKRRASGDFRA